MNDKQKQALRDLRWYYSDDSVDSLESEKVETLSKLIDAMLDEERYKVLDELIHDPRFSDFCRDQFCDLKGQKS